MRPIRYGDIRQILTSVADTTVTITSPTKRHFLITGSAAMYVLVLPDAQTIRLGTPFVFENMSSEFVGVRNSDSTTWHRVPPRATLTCVLGTQATAAGTWYSMTHDPAVYDPRYGFSKFSDYTYSAASSYSYGEPAITVAVSATAGATAAFSNVVPVYGQGILTCNTGTNAAGWAQLYGPDGLFNEGCRAVSWRMSVSELSTVAEEFISRWGMRDNAAGGAPTEGAFFLYDRAALGANWWIRTIKTTGGAAVTTLDSGVAVVGSNIETGWQILRVETSSAGTRAEFIIDQLLVSPAGGLANLPVIATNLSNDGITKTNGVTSRWNRRDWLLVQHYPTVLR